MAVPFAVQGETNEMKRAFWDGNLLARCLMLRAWDLREPTSRIANVPACSRTCLCVGRRQWGVSGLEN